MRRNLFALLAFLLALQAALTVNGSPTSKKVATAEPESSSQRLSALNNASLPKYKAPRKAFSRDVDIDTLPLKDLVDMKPLTSGRKEDKERYRQLFASHPNVQKINFFDTKAKVVQDLIGLSGDGNHSREWKFRMAASIRNHLDDTLSEDPVLRDDLKEQLTGQRYHKLRYDANRRYQHNVGSFEMRKRRRETEAKYRERHGMGYGPRSKNLREDESGRNLPLSAHFGEGDMTALEAAEKTKDLGHLYSSQRTLTRMLEDHLKEKKAPSEEIAAAMGVRAKMLERQSRVKSKARERENEEASTSAPAHTSAPFVFQMAPTSSSKVPAIPKNLQRIASSSRLPSVRSASSAHPSTALLPVNQEKTADVRLPLPHDLDMNQTPLTDLINMKPSKEDLKEDHRRYRNYFANHPDVSKINLHDDDLSKVTEAILGLSQGSNNQSKQWKIRSSTSVRQFIQNSSLDKARKETLLASLKGQRVHVSRVQSHKKWAAKLGPEEIRRRKGASEVEYFRQHGARYSSNKKKQERSNPLLNRPLSFHLGRDLTALQAEEKARDLLPYYTSQQTLTKKLEDYLKARKFSKGDVVTALGVRTKHLLESSVDKSRSKGKAKAPLTPPLPSPPVSPPAGPSTGYLSLGHDHSNIPHTAAAGILPTSPHDQVHQEHHTSPRQTSSAHFDPTDPKEWQWFTEVMRD